MHSRREYGSSRGGLFRSWLESGGLVRRRRSAPAEAALACLVAEITLLVPALISPTFGKLLSQLGAVFPVSGIGVAAITLALAIILSYASARVVNRRDRSGRAGLGNASPSYSLTKPAARLQHQCRVVADDALHTVGPISESVNWIVDCPEMRNGAECLHRSRHRSNRERHAVISGWNTERVVREIGNVSPKQRRPQQCCHLWRACAECNTEIAKRTGCPPRQSPPLLCDRRDYAVQSLRVEDQWRRRS